MWLSCLKLWLSIFGALKFHAIYKNCPLFSSQCTKFIQNLYMDKTVNLKEKIHLYTAFDRFYSLLLLKIISCILIHQNHGESMSSDAGLDHLRARRCGTL